MRRSLITTFILAALSVLSTTAFGQGSDAAPKKSAAAKPKSSKPASVKPKSEKSKPEKIDPVQASPVQTAVEAAPPQSAAERPLLTEDDPLPFMRTDEANAPAEPSSGGLILKSVGALLLVIGLLVFGTWSMKKLGFGNKAAKSAAGEVGLEVLSSMPMGGGKTLAMVQFGERVLLVGSTAQSFTLLAEHGPAENDFTNNPRSVADLLADDEDGGSFDDEFEQAMARLEGSRVYGGVN